MKPIAAAVAGALISGVVMYTVGAKTAQVDAFTQDPAYVQTLDGQFVPVAQPVRYTTALRPAAPVAVRRTSAAPRQTVYRTTAPAAQERVVYEDAKPERSWTKTAMIIGGSAATGAGVGGMVKGKKGAMVGAAIGGGAASIYEATRRR